jgi:hypothetical protein
VTLADVDDASDEASGCEALRLRGRVGNIFPRERGGEGEAMGTERKKGTKE